MAGIKHQFTSAKADGGDTTLVRPSDWNAEHLLGGSVKFDAGTSFPGSPTADDLCYRTDRNLLYFYDGTRWLTVTLYNQVFGTETANVAASVDHSAFTTVWTGDYDQWLVDLRVSYYVITTNDGTKYWTFDLRSDDGASSASIITTNTSAASASTWTKQTSSAINALLGTAKDGLELGVSKTSSPGNIYWGAMVTYRLVG